MMKNLIIKPVIHILVLLIPAFFIAGGAAQAKMVSDVYPLLSDRFLKSAELVEAESGMLLKTGTGISISLQDFETSLNQYDPKLQGQIKENLIFLLDQDIITRILLQEAQKSGIQDKNTESGDQISAYLASRVKDVTVTGKDAQTFYDESKEMMGGAPFDQVREKQVLAGRFGIQSIPVQVFFDKTGNEVFRHTGFFAEKEVLNQLQKMGVQ